MGFFTAGCLRWGLRATALSGFALSTFIELSQLTGNWGLAGFTYRTFDVDDIVNNTVGAVLGAVCVWVVRAIRKRRAAKHERALSVSAASA